MAIAVNDTNFDELVLNAGKPALVDFWAEWCGPCKMLSPVIDEIAEEATDVKVCKVNIDDQMALAKKYFVMSIPTIIVFKDGKPARRHVGTLPKEDILEMLGK